MLHMFFNSYTHVSLVFQTYGASVSIVFGRVMQMFPLDVAKVDLPLYILQWRPPICSSRPCSCWAACMHVGVEGPRAAARKTMRAQIETEASVGHRAARGTKRAQDTERRGRLDASLRPDLRALAFPVSNLIYVAGALRAGPMEVNSLW
jgi:hypothetical protein